QLGRAVDDADSQRRGETANPNLVLREVPKRNAGSGADRLRDDQLATVLLGEVLQSRGDVNGLADRRRLRVLAIPQRADDDLAGVNADAETDRLLQLIDQGAVHFRQVPVDQASRFQSLTTGLVGLGFAAEDRHHAVADELVGRAAGRNDRAPYGFEEP